jgi:hypothetical protein
MAEKLGARQNSSFKAVSMAPDICKTPVGSSTPPIPYQVIADLGQSTKTVPNVRFNGNPCKVLDQSTVPTCTGDEPGGAKGVKSGTVADKAEPVSASTTVRATRKRVVREQDPCTLNSGNCPGIYTTQPAPGSSIGTGGKPTADTNPPVKLTPAEERGFMEKAGKWWKQTKTELGAAARNPGEAAVGALKDTANTVPEVGEMMARGSALNQAAEMEQAAAMQRLFGMTRSADQLQASAEALRQVSDKITLPKFELRTLAEAGGAKAAMMGQLAAGLVTLVRGATKIGVQALAKSGGRAAAGEVNDAARILVKTSSATRDARVADTAGDVLKTEQALAKDGRQLVKGEEAVQGVKETPKGDGIRIKRTAHEGAAFGEEKAHAKMNEMGYERIDRGGEYKPGRNGLDGVYKNPKPPPDYIIMEAKYNTAKLGDTLDGKQMSDSWMNGEKTGFDRLREAVGPRTADKIRESMDAGRVQKMLLHVDESGNVSVKALDQLGNIIKP